jgi:hypothetical protein
MTLKYQRFTAVFLLIYGRRENVGASIRAANEHYICLKGWERKERDVSASLRGKCYEENSSLRWAKRFFSEGRESVTDEERSGRPSTSRTEENIAKMRQIVR